MPISNNEITSAIYNDVIKDVADLVEELSPEAKKLYEKGLKLSIDTLISQKDNGVPLSNPYLLIAEKLQFVLDENKEKHDE